MRSISHIVAGEIAHNVKNANWLESFFYQVARRADDMLEILSYYAYQLGHVRVADGKIRKITCAMKRGFARRLSKYDEYQLAKYRCQGKKLTLIDLVNLVHPKSTPALTKLMKDELKTAEGTFESNISEAGREAAKAETEEAAIEIKSEAWGELITSRRIGYMALLKNLRNILQQSPQYLGAALELLQDRNLIKGSMVLPFRYYTAYKEIQELGSSMVRTVLPALAHACDIALDNVPKLPGRSLIALDVSGSMRDHLEIAAQIAAELYKANDAALMLFDTTGKYLALNPLETTLTLQGTILMNARAGGGTDFNAVMLAANERYDRIIFISDEQHWVRNENLPDTYKSYCRSYCKKSEARPSIFMLNVVGSGTLSFPAEKMYAVAGFSEKVLDVMKLLEEDRLALIHKIEAVELRSQGPALVNSNT